MAQEVEGVGFRLSRQQAAWLALEARLGRSLRSSVSVAWRDALDPQKLRQTLERLSERHEILRTVLRPVPGLSEPVQSIQARPSYRVDVLEAGVTDPRGLVERAASKPGAPTLVVAIAAGPEGEQRLLLSLPGCSFDEFALEQLVNEILRDYASVDAGGAGLDAQALQFVDYSEWQHELFDGDLGREGVAFWQGLPAAEPARRLPFERPSASVLEVAVLALPSPAFVEPLGALAAALQADRRELLFFLWAAFLARLLDSETVTLAWLADRRREELLNVLGRFAKRMPVQCTLGARASVQQAFELVRSRLEQCNAWEECLDERWGAGDPGGAGAWGELLGFKYRRRSGVAALAADVSIVEPAVERLWLDCSDRRGDLELGIGYHSERFAADTIGTWARQFQAFVEHCARDTRQALGSVSLSGAAERRICEAWSLGPAAQPKPGAAREPSRESATLYGLFARQAARVPDAIAVAGSGSAASYAELERRAGVLAARLRARGVQPDEVVGVYFERSVEVVIAVLGVLRAGAAYLPLDPSYPSERLTSMLQDAAVRYVVGDVAAGERRLASQVQWLDVPRDLPASDAAPGEPPEQPASTLAYLIYTSGSTGRPKGVMVSQANAVSSTLARSEFYPQPVDRFLLLSSFSFDSSVAGLFWTLAGGGTLCLPGADVQRDPAALAQLLQDLRISHLLALPSLYAQLLEVLAESALSVVVVAGEACPPTLPARHVERLPATTLANEYGPTEGSVWCTAAVLEQHPSEPVSIGRPIGAMRAHVLDGAGEPCPVGVAGELFIGGPGVARGYRGRPSATAERFIPDASAPGVGERVYRTGDRVRWRPDGQLEYLGRLDHQVKLRGFRIELGEVEAQALADVRVAQACAVVREDQPGDQRLVLYVVAQGGADPGSTGVDHLVEAVRQRLASALPEYMLPNHIVPLTALPLGPTGKLAREALPPPGQGQLGREYAEPGTELGRAIAAIWKEILGVERVGAQDDFFALGGHSLLVTKVTARLRAAFGVNVPVRLLFEHTELEAFAARVAEAQERGAPEPSVPLSRVPRGAPLPMSSAQRRLWFLWQLEPESAAYNVPTAVRLRGRLNALALQATLDALVARHEALRTTFSEDAAGHGWQHVQPVAAASLRRHSLAEVPAAERDRELRRRAEAEARKPFDLRSGPVLRAELLEVAEAEHVLCITLHHIVCDGWSAALLLEEFTRLYAALCSARDTALPPLPVQYADYAVWQQHWLRSKEAERQLDYWQRRLGTEHPAIELPVDRARPAEQTYRGGSYSFVLDARATAQLRELAVRQDATLAMLLLAAFAVLLHRHGGSTDLRLGTTLANRHRVELENVVGFFVNTLVLRLDLANDPTFSALLAAVRELSLEAQEHQDLPFQQLVEALDPERSLSQNPLFQVAFNHQWRRSRGPTELGGLELQALAADTHATQFDLELSTFEGEDTVRGVVAYSSDLFDARTIESLMFRFERLLAGIASRPEQRLSQLPLSSEEEHSELAVARNRSDCRFESLAARFGGVPPVAGEPANPLCAEAWQTDAVTIVRRQALHYPERVAASADGAALSYGELIARVERVTARLSALGVSAEQPVAVLAPRGLELLVVLLGVLAAGGAYVPLDPRQPPQRLLECVRLAQPRVLICTTSSRDSLQGVLGGASTVRWLDLGGVGLVSDAVRGTELALAAHLPRRGRALAYVIHTSGSTGTPKGAMVEHAGMLNHLSSKVAWLDLRDSDVVAQTAPQTFDISIWQLLSPLLVGGRVEVVAGDVATDPRALLEHVNRTGVTVLESVPSLINALLEAEAVPLPGLRALLATGEALAPALVQRWLERYPAIPIDNAYGPTECSDDVSMHRSSRPPLAGERMPIGNPIENTRLYVLDAALGLAPAGVVGELYVGGIGVGRGYLFDPRATAYSFLPDPFSDLSGARLYRTGDRARWRNDGALEFIGRVDEQVKINGNRIEPGEIAACLQRHPDVVDAVVLARAFERGTRLVAYAASRRAAAAQDTAGELVQELRAYLSERLPAYMVPAHLVVLAQLPLTPNGKLDRKALPEPLPSSAESAGQLDSAVEHRLAAIWSQVLGVSTIGPNDNFFELGGDSILSLRVVNLARQAGLSLSPRDVFQRQTVRALALVAERATAPRALDSQGGPARLTPLQTQFFEAGAPERRWNQAVLLRSHERLEPAPLAAALQQVLAQHPALRSEFARDARGEWRSAPVALALASAPAWQHALLRTRRAASLAGLAEMVEDVRGGIGIAGGPLLRAALVELEDGSQRLLLAAHHLVMDGVSWRILLEDLQAAYGQVAAGQALALPPASSSLQAWSDALQGYAAGSARAELDYWLRELAPGEFAELPRTGTATAAYVAEQADVDVRLDAEQTRRLLKDAPRAYRTQINDLLLTALARALCRSSGAPQLLVELEGHGREDIFPDVDVSRTVGCFTAAYPARLAPDVGDGAQALGNSVKAVKEQLRAVPNRGLGFGALRYLADADVRERLSQCALPRVTFNYLGQFDGAFDEHALFRPAPEGSGRGQSAGDTLDNWLTVSGQVYGHELRLRCTYSQQMYAQETVQALLDACRDELQALIEHCTSGVEGGLTPSDFPLARLTQGELDAIALPSRQIADIYPVSPVQQGMLFHSALDPQSGVYLNQLSVGVEGLDAPRFERAWQALTERHEVLRTSFLRVGRRQELRQVVQASVPQVVSVQDYRGRSEVQAELGKLLEAERARGFDIDRAPLQRVQLVRLAEDRHQLVWTYHHALLDGWSSARLVEELLLQYSGADLPAPVGRFRDYIGWLGAQSPERSEAFWREQLARLDQPTLLGRGPQQRLRARGEAVWKSVLDAEQTALLRRYCRSAHITLNTLIQAAWIVLLQRRTARQTVAFGATVAGRPTALAGVEQMLGLFINTLPVIQGAGPSEDIGAWLRQLQDHNVALRDHEHTALYDLQRWAGSARQAFFDTLLVFENYPVDRVLRSRSTGSLRFHPAASHEPTNYPLTVKVYGDDSLSIDLEYQSDQFEAEQVRDIATDLLGLTRQLAGEEVRRVGELRLASAREPRPRVPEAQVSSVRPAPTDLAQALALQAALTPDAVAVVCAGSSLSYRELDVRAELLARRLRSLGVGPEVLVGICLERSLELVTGLLAILKAGGAYLPLDPAYPASRLRYMLEDSRARVVLTRAELAAQLPSLPIRVLDVDRGLADPESPDFLDTPRPPLHADNLAYCIYTSGSTGKPKGALLSQRNVLRLFEVTREQFEFGANDVWTLFHSFAFDFSVWEIFGALLYGGRLVVVPQDVSRAPERFWQLLLREQVTVLNQTPSAFEHLLQAALAGPGEEPPVRPALRSVIFGGEALDASRLSPWFARFGEERPRLINMYGITETTVHVTERPVRRADGQSDASLIGQPLADLSLELLDPAGHPVPPGVAGEIHVGGSGLARGYMGRPALTAERFVPDPRGRGARLYRSGDAARPAADGDVEYLGRLDQQVKVRGYRIELGEIEAQLREHARVRSAAVVLRRGRTGDHLVAYVVGAGNPGELGKQLRERLLQTLPDYMRPSHVVIVDELPLTHNGKLDRAALPEPDAGQAGHVEPQTPLGRELAAIWREILGVERVGVGDDFFELGGHSLLAQQLVSRIRVQLGVHLQLRVLFEQSSFADLKRWIESQPRELAAADVAELEELLLEVEAG